MKRAPYLLAGLAASLIGVSGVQAHPKLTASAPAANQVSASTNRVVLSFNEKLVSQFSKAEVFMTDMPGMKMKAPMKMTGAKTEVGPDGQTLIVSFPKALPTGTYSVAYQVVSADTHRIEGRYVFQVR